MKIKVLLLISLAIIAAILYINPLMLTNPNIMMLTVGDIVDEIKSNVLKNNNKKDYSSLINSINRYLSHKDGTYGIYFISLTSGQFFGINENNIFIAASTVKLPINLYLFNLIEQKKVDPAMLLTYTKDDYENGTGIIQSEKFGKTYSIEELSRLSIVYSDNVAINMLIRYLSRNDIYNFMETTVSHAVDKNRNISTPKDMAIYMKAILDFREKNKILGEQLLDNLMNTKFNDRIPLYIPENIPIAHKVGNQVKAVHDVGAVFAKRPFIISIMSENVDENKAPEVIAQITRMVYDFEQK